jgi:hypothetical protein
VKQSHRDTEMVCDLYRTLPGKSVSVPMASGATRRGLRGLSRQRPKRRGAAKTFATLSPEQRNALKVFLELLAKKA